MDDLYWKMRCVSAWESFDEDSEDSRAEVSHIERFVEDGFTNYFLSIRDCRGDDESLSEYVERITSAESLKRFLAEELQQENG